MNYGGPDGEIGASMRYLNQRYAMPYKECKGILTDIGTEELGHVEMISTMAFQLMEGATIEELDKAGLGGHFTQFNHALFPADPNPYSLFVPRV